MLLKPSLVYVTLYDWSSYYGQQRAFLGVERKCVSNQAGVKREPIWSVPKAPTCSPPAPHFVHLWHRNYAWVPQNFTCPKHTPQHTHTYTHTHSNPHQLPPLAAPGERCVKRKPFASSHRHTHTYTQTTVCNIHKSIDWWKFSFLFVLADFYGGQYCVIESLFCLKCLYLTILQG